MEFMHAADGTDPETMAGDIVAALEQFVMNVAGGLDSVTTEAARLGAEDGKKLAGK